MDSLGVTEDSFKDQIFLSKKFVEIDGGRKDVGISLIGQDSNNIDDRLNRLYELLYDGYKKEYDTDEIKTDMTFKLKGHDGVIWSCIIHKNQKNGKPFWINIKDEKELQHSNEDKDYFYDIRYDTIVVFNNVEAENKLKDTIYWPFDDVKENEGNLRDIFEKAVDWSREQASKYKKKNAKTSQQEVCFNAFLLSTYLYENCDLKIGRDEFLNKSLSNIIYDIKFNGANEETKIVRLVKDCNYKNWIYRFANLAVWGDKLKYLKSKIKEEEWTYPEKNEDGILDNYLRYTFVRLLREGKVKANFVEDNKEYKIIAAFNTGLVDDTYKEWCAVFIENKYYPTASDQPFCLMDYCVPGESLQDRLGKEIFSSLNQPEAANYFLKNEKKEGGGLVWRVG